MIKKIKVLQEIKEKKYVFQEIKIGEEMFIPRNRVPMKNGIYFLCLYYTENQDNHILEEHEYDKVKKELLLTKELFYIFEVEIKEIKLILTILSAELYEVNIEYLGKNIKSRYLLFKNLNLYADRLTCCFQKNKAYLVNKKKAFIPNVMLEKEDISSAFDFAYNMTFGKKGEHRNHRSEGKLQRKNGEIFANTYSGKLAEIGIYNFFLEKGIELNKPDFDTWELGSWDEYDFKYKENEISVKSTTHFGNLLLLETKDWNSYGKYKPNSKKYDYHICVRIYPDSKKILKNMRLYYLTELTEEQNKDLKQGILHEEWKVEISGFISNFDLINIIKEGYVIQQDSLLNKSIKMDAENYYIQYGDLRKIDLLVTILREMYIKNNFFYLNL